ncbi:MAG: type II secretion system protein [Fibrobacter sp.]|nr:type II secretion system protein [Fibrobacter sp.]
MKKGFTLIEIMVVIVIMGVLAAVGVPKLFAMIAKAKASEAPTAAGVYIHLQEAYQADKTVIGSWKNIGYEAPGTNGVSSYFKYKSCADEDIVYDGNQSAAIGWIATSLSGLNDCALGSSWAVTVSILAERSLVYATNVNSDECTKLTHNWTVANIGDECEGNSGNTQQASNDPEPQQQQQPEQQPDEQTQSSPSQDVDCQALKDAHNAEHGNKNGWVDYPRCGTKVPPGVAKDLPGCSGNGNKLQCE